MRVIRAGVKSLTLAAVATGGCASTPEPRPGATPVSAAAVDPEEGGLVSLANGVEPFRERFNASDDRARFVAILSPTCGPCVSGAVTTNESLVRGFDAAQIDISVVWIDVLPTDGLDSATRAATIFTNPRVTQYHDPNQRLGDAFAEGLLDRGPAWDIYLFYPPRARWGDRPPAPFAWQHQLGGGVAPPDRYRVGAALAAAMHEAMLELGFETDDAAPDAARLAAARSAATARIGAAVCGDNEEGSERCARCAASGSIGQCSISGWRYVVAQLARDDAGLATNRFELSGAVSGPVALGAVDPADVRHEFTIEGMTCPDCTTAVAGKALVVRGVTRVEVDYDRKRLVVYASNDPATKLDMLPDHLRLAGYELTPVPGSP